VTFNGFVDMDISGNGNGVKMDNFGTVHFNAGSDIKVENGVAFEATGGGNLKYDDPAGSINNTISATTGQAVDLANITLINPGFEGRVTTTNTATGASMSINDVTGSGVNVFIANLSGAAVSTGLDISGSSRSSGVIIAAGTISNGARVNQGGSGDVTIDASITENAGFAFQVANRSNGSGDVTVNGAITSGTITNYSAKPTRRIDLIIGVSYDADLAKTKAVLARVVESNTLVLKEPGVTIGVSELADNSVNLVVRPWVKSENYWPVYFELLENIKVALDEAGIEIPYPQLSLHVNQEENHGT
jgi:hypothetical protein